MNHLPRALDKQNQWWKYLCLFLVALIFAPLMGCIPLIIIELSGYNMGSNTRLAVHLLPFAVALLAVRPLFKSLHKRNIKEVINGTNAVRWNKFFFAMFLWMILFGITLAIEYMINPGNFVLNFSIRSFIPLLLISIVLIPVQASFEEVVFRGYLTQGVAAWTRSRWLALLIPSLLFGLMHYFNPEVKEYGFWSMMPFYIIMGLLLGLAAILDDGIESAMGAHTANNLGASVFVSFKTSALPTESLLEVKSFDPLKDTLLLLLICIIFTFVLARRYKWKFSTLNKKVVPGSPEEV